MRPDERAIREVHSTWIDAVNAGDLACLLSLMADDVVFLVPGRPPIRKDEFAAASRAQVSASAPRIDGSSDIQEIKVIGDWAFMWSRLRVVATPPDGSPPIERAGHTLSILRKQNGRWLLARDANMLAPVQSPN